MNPLNQLDRLDETVWGRWCPLETLGWASVLVGSALLSGSAVAMSGLLILRNVIR